ncbi:MAG: hypothetical protein U0Q16_14380 [Bryobacteraceae bacterium]
MKRNLVILFAAPAMAATFGTVVTVTGGATDLALDEARGRLYVVNNTQNRVDVYSTAQKRFLNPIAVGNQPLSVAMSRGGKKLYVTAYQGSSLDIVDLDAGSLEKRVTLPAAPEGVAVGGDERVLITTVGSGTGNAENRLMLYDPNFNGTGDNPRAIATTLPAPAAPQVPAPSSRVFMSTRSNLAASANGQWIIGLNNPTAAARQLFVYEVGSASILRSRTLTSISNVLAVSGDGARFMAGLSLFDAGSLAIEAQQNTANAMHAFPNNTNFNTQQNQGGSVFAPDGSVLYSAFNVAPVQNPAARANTSMLMLSDPDNLLIKLTLQLPENLAGNMVISNDGATIYALSQSGFLVLPVSTIYDNPIAVVDAPVALVMNDQCGVTAAAKKVSVTVRNAGKGRMTATAQVQQTGPTFTFPIAGQAGGAAPGAIPIVLPPGPGGVGGGTIVLPPGAVPGAGATATTAQQTGVTQNAPNVATRRTDTETIFDFTFNTNAARSLGTIAPTDFLVQSPEAINVPSRVRISQNNRNSEARGTVIPVAVSASSTDALSDVVSDTARRRLYIANSGMNSVEVFDTRTNAFVKSIKVGQLPKTLAMTPGGRQLYVANSGGESIWIIDLETLEASGKVRFPAVPYNASFALVTPNVIAATLTGLEVVMSDGSLWHVRNGEAMPRSYNPVISAAVQTPRTMVATAGGEFAMLLGGNGTAYLFDGTSGEWVLSQSVVTTPIQGYFGPVAAGPGGRYFVVNGTVLNASLTPVSGGTVTRPVAAVTSLSATMIARYTIPAQTTATQVVRDVPTVELVDATTGAVRGSSAALEGLLASQVGNARSNVNGRMMAMNAEGDTAYVLTATGLSVIPVVAAATGGPGGANSTAVAVSQNGIVNSASLQTAVAPGTPISIFGQNLAGSATASTNADAPLPSMLGGSCVTVDESPIPLFMTAAGQITAQLPVTLTAGSHTLVVRAPDRNLASASRTFTVAKYAPAVMINPDTGQAAVFRADGSAVTKQRKAKRDEPLSMYAVGLGATTGAKIVTGAVTPASPAAETSDVNLYFGDSRYSQAAIMVDWSGLVPGMVGVYRIDFRIPGDHFKGDEVPVKIVVGNVSSPVTGSAVPTLAVE